MIGIFDSGIGGVTVLKELIKELPNENYLYYSDSINNPYGDKEYDEIIKYADDIVSYLIKNGCKLIIIACNTASAITKDYLRNKYKDIQIVAIEPAYKVVYDYAKNNKTLIMATKATIKSDKFIELYNKYNNNNTILCSCSGLAELIEKGDKDKIINYLKNNIGQYKGVKNVVLGCTHYPLIKKEIKQILGDVLFFDGSIGVSKRVKDLLTTGNMLEKNSKATIKFIDSSNSKEKELKFFEILNT